MNENLIDSQCIEIDWIDNCAMCKNLMDLPCVEIDDPTMNENLTDLSYASV